MEDHRRLLLSLWGLLTFAWPALTWTRPGRWGEHILHLGRSSSDPAVSATAHLGVGLVAVCCGDVVQGSAISPAGRSWPTPSPRTCPPTSPAGRPRGGSPPRRRCGPEGSGAGRPVRDRHHPHLRGVLAGADRRAGRQAAAGGGAPQSGCRPPTRSTHHGTQRLTADERGSCPRRTARLRSRRLRRQRTSAVSAVSGPPSPLDGARR